MKTAISYGCATYGNSSNAENYLVKLARHGTQISLAFEFRQPAEGRGVGPGKGQVERISLDLPQSTANALSHALLLALADTASAGIEFSICEGGQEDDQNGPFDRPISLAS